jgi:hypothetical protein
MLFAGWLRLVGLAAILLRVRLPDGSVRRVHVRKVPGVDGVTITSLVRTLQCELNGTHFTRLKIRQETLNVQNIVRTANEVTINVSEGDFVDIVGDHENKGEAEYLHPVGQPRRRVPASASLATRLTSRITTKSQGPIVVKITDDEVGSVEIGERTGNAMLKILTEPITNAHVTGRKLPVALLLGRKDKNHREILAFVQILLIPPSNYGQANVFNTSRVVDAIRLAEKMGLAVVGLFAEDQRIQESNDFEASHVHLVLQLQSVVSEYQGPLAGIDAAMIMRSRKISEQRLILEVGKISVSFHVLLF